MKKVLFFASILLTAGAVHATALDCSEPNGSRASFRLGKSKLTVLFIDSVVQPVGDLKLIAETPVTMTFYKRPSNSNNGIPFLTSVPSALLGAKVGTTGTVTVTFTDTGYDETVRVYECEVFKPGREY